MYDLLGWVAVVLMFVIWWLEERPTAVPDGRYHAMRSGLMIFVTSLNVKHGDVIFVTLAAFAACVYLSLAVGGYVRYRRGGEVTR